MKINLKKNDVYQILDDWCKREHGAEIIALQWQVDFKNGVFEGVFIQTDDIFQQKEVYTNG